MADWESQRIDRTSIDDLVQLIGSFQQMGVQAEARQRGRIEDRSAVFTKLLETTNDLDTMTSVGERIKKYDSELDDKGFDEDGDILVQLYNSKYDVMQKGQAAYDELSSMQTELGIDGQPSFDKVKNKILDEDWSVVNNKLRKMFVLQSHLESAKGMKFKGSEKLDPAMLQATVTQYQSLYANKLTMLARTGAYDIPDEQIQAFDEEFGVQLMSLAPADFSKMMGRHQIYVQGLYGDAEQKANYYYDKWKKAENTGAETNDLQIAGLDIGEVDLIVCYDSGFTPIRMI